MTATVVNTSDGKRIDVRCDTCGCDAPAVDDRLAAHGLINMGWYCAGGTHICADCLHPSAERPDRCS